MTRWLDAPIAFDPLGQAINPAIEYLAWVAWGDDLPNRQRFAAALVSAFFKQAGKQVPKPLPRLKSETLAVTVHKGLARIQLRCAPAVLMVASQWATHGRHDLLARIGGSTEQQPRLADSFALAAGRLRGQEVMPRTLHDIGRDVWLDARPALAMTMALPIAWAEIATVGAAYDDYHALMLLCSDPRWVADAIRNALDLAVRIEATINPTALLAPRPRIWQGRGTWVSVRKQALSNLLALPASRL